MQRGAADAGYQWIGGWPLHDAVVVEGIAGPVESGNAVVVRRAEHGDAVPPGVDVRVAKPQHVRPAREVLLGEAEALADDVAQVVLDHVVLGRDHLREAAAGGGLLGRRLDQQDVRARGHGVCPLHVQRGLAGLVDHACVAGVERRDRALGLQHPERGRGRQAEAAVEGREVGADGRRADRVDDHDRPAAAAVAPRIQRPQAVCPLELPRPVAGDAESLEALRAGGRRAHRGGGARGRHDAR